MKNKKVMMVGSAEKSGGGISSVLKLMKKMPIWDKYSCYWLGTQIQRNGAWKAYYAIRACLLAPFIMWKYDIVHFHCVPGTGLFTQLPQLLFAKLYRKKVILEIHIGNQLTNNRNNEYFKWWLKRADLILLLSYKWMDLFHEIFPDINKPTDVLYNACELVPEVTKSEKKKLILFAGYMNDNKAPHLLLEAWKQIKGKYPDWHVTLMGNGDVERFKMLAADFGLGDCVDFPGYVVGNEKEKILRASSIYCMCSYEEGFPMVVLESWAHSTAVITTSVGGLPDVIEDGVNCLTIPFGNSECLADSLVRLIEDEDLRWTIGNNGREMAMERFSTDAINKVIDKIYSQI